jgi:colanic acid/amylovoran biosynthesis glycosyltransferase
MLQNILVVSQSRNNQKIRGRLAIVVPHSGQPTETFIRRYAEKLDPGNVVMVHFEHGAEVWGLDAPTYFPEQTFGGSRLMAKAWRGAQKVARIESLFGDPLMAGSLRRFLRNNNVTAVFSQYLVAGATVQEVVGSLGLRHVVRGHGFDLSSSLEQAEWQRRYLVLEDCAAIVVPTQYQENRLRVAGLKSVPICRQPCGIDLPASNVEQHDGRNEIRVVSAGRMVEKKAPLLAAQAFLKAVEVVPELRMIMVGDGPLRDQVQALCDRHPLGKRVSLIGALAHEDTLRQIAGADVFLQHSLTDPHTGDQEGAPVAILEAMARGVPVVSTRHSGIPYLVEENSTGLLSAEGDAAAMAANLIALAKDAGLRRRMGDAGRMRVEQFTWERERDLLLDLLSNVATKE